MEIIEVDEVDTSALGVSLLLKIGKYPVIVDELTKSYGDHVVFKDQYDRETGQAGFCR